MTTNQTMTVPTSYPTLIKAIQLDFPREQIFKKDLKMIYVEAPKITTENKKSLFLAGGITGCPDWQKEVVDNISDLDIIVYNPRRKNFPIDDPTASFKQIKWEHDMLRKADIISFWFCSETMCPIVLYELGAWSMTQKPLVIGMDPEYSRRQDVEIQTKLVRPELAISYNLDSLITNIIEITDQANFVS